MILLQQKLALAVSF